MKKTVCICRLRSNVNYTDPLQSILGFWYELMQKFVEDHKSEYDFVYYNFGFNKKPKRDIDAIKAADVIIIPSEAEFQYHIPGYIHTLDKKSSDTEVKKVYDSIKPTCKLILLQSDRKDNPELYKTLVFPGMKNKIVSIDEIDFKGTIQAAKYWILKDYINNLIFVDHNKEYDYCYYGCDKSKDVGGVKSLDPRTEVNKTAKKDVDINSFFVGRFSFEPDMKFQKDLKAIIPYMLKSRATLCFNWPGYPNAVTARYGESIACGMIPLVWNTYDQNNSVVTDEWQRCTDFNDFKNKLIQLRDPVFFQAKFSQIRADYEANKILPYDEYYRILSEKLVDNLTF